MIGLRFEWNSSKASRNLLKHGVSFEEAESIFTNQQQYRHAWRIRFQPSQPNPYTQRLKKQITIRLDEDTIAYFKAMADEKGIPYQSLINLYLRDCAASERKLNLSWTDSK